MSEEALPPLPLPSGITEKQVDCPLAGLNFHILEAGYTPARNKPLILLLHGYPELAFSWRKIMPALANAGYYVVAPDQRGYGRTTGWDTSSWEKTDLSQFTLTNLVCDLVILVNALGYQKVKCVVGHDFGAVSSSMCALMRPDIFESCIMMSHPFNGTPSLPFNTAHDDSEPQNPNSKLDMEKELANLPTPRKHYIHYNSTQTAAEEWDQPPQILSTFLRGYIHLKSGDWRPNNPHPLQGWTAADLAGLPEYYIMPLHLSIPQVVERNMQGEDASLTKRWLSDADLDVYVSEWTRTGFQGGLNWYRSTLDAKCMRELYLFAGRTIDVPTAFVSGQRDWGNHQQPGALERLPERCSQFKGVKLVEGAGHWPQQEKPEEVVQEILAFLKTL